MFTKTISALVILSTLATGAVAIAAPGAGANQDIGFITDLDTKDRTLTLSDGMTFELPYGMDMQTLDEGQKVLVTWDQIGGSVLARSVVFSN